MSRPRNTPAREAGAVEHAEPSLGSAGSGARFAAGRCWSNRRNCGV